MVFELFQKLHLLIYATQLMTLKIIPFLFVLLNLEIVERKGKNYKNLNILITKGDFPYHLVKNMRTEALIKKFCNKICNNSFEKYFD